MSWCAIPVGYLHKNSNFSWTFHFFFLFTTFPDSFKLRGQFVWRLNTSTTFFSNFGWGESVKNILYIFAKKRIYYICMISWKYFRAEINLHVISCAANQRALGSVPGLDLFSSWFSIFRKLIIIYMYNFFQATIG